MRTSKFIDVIKMDTFKEESSDQEPKCSPERPSSPIDCAICLEQLKDKSFTNSCLHMFCFHCLEAWSKVKAECPLCKQDFCSIIHNIRSMTDYDEYHVPPVEARLSVTPPFVTPNDIADNYSRDFFSNRRRFFSYRTTIMPNAFSIPRVRSSNLVIQPYIDNLELEGNFSHVNSMQSSVSRCNRAEIYVQGLETRPPSTGRYRESSPQFYRENETQLHRLTRWLHRDLMALSQIGVRFVLHEVQRMILDMLVLYNINSSIFHTFLSQHLGVHTSRFIRELYHFATSPYEMDQYDRECVYVRRRNGSQLSFIVTVGRDESEDVQVIPSTSLEPPVRSWIDVDRVNPSSYQSSNSGLEFSSRFPNYDTFPCSNVAAPSTSSNTSNSVINLADSDNDDCIILDDAPAPETIVLDDSDNEVDNLSTSESIRVSPKPIDLFSSNHRPLDLSMSRSISSQTSDQPPNEFPRQLPDAVSVSNESNRTHLFDEPEMKFEHVACHRFKHGQRNRSDSSVLSTCISSDESDYSRKRKRNKRACKVRSRRQVHRKFSSDDFSHDSSAKSDQSDSDWEESRRKRKKKLKKSHTDKREKKLSSKKLKKSTERKSKKKKVSSTPCAIDSDRCGEKLPKLKLKNKLRCSRPSVEVIESPRLPTTKLCSVVKVVHRENDFENLMDQPSTSSGHKGFENRHNFVNFDRNVYLSDSD